MSSLFSKIVGRPIFLKRKRLFEKINSLPLFHVCFLILVFFLPFQKRYHNTIKRFSEFAFRKEVFSPFFLHQSLSFYLGDFLLIALLCLSFSSLRGRARDLFWSKSQKYLTAFLIIMLISIIFSASGGMIWPYYRWIQFALPALACSFLIGMPNCERLIKITFWLLLAGGLLQFLIVVDQYILQEAVGLRQLGEAKIHYESSASFLMRSKMRWIFDNWLGKTHSSILILRPYGTLFHPNVLGAFLGMTIFASSYLFLTSQKKMLFGGAILLQIFALFLSFSRGAIFGLVGGGLVFFTLLLTRKEWRKLAVQLITIYLLGSTLSLGILHEQFISRGGVVNYSGAAKESDSNRLRFQKMAFRMAKERPMLGHGLDQYEQQIPRFVDPKSGHEVQRVHNAYLIILTEMGGLGLLAFLGFFCSLFYWTLRKGLDLIGITLVTILVYFLWIGCVDQLMIACYAPRMMLFIMMGLLAAHVLGKEISFFKS